MFPSPSLTPPLLSLSESPPLFCGIPDVDALDELLVDELAAGALDDVLDELEPPPPPQPATTRPASTSTPAVDGLMLCVVMSFSVLFERYVSAPPHTRGRLAQAILPWGRRPRQLPAATPVDVCLAPLGRVHPGVLALVQPPLNQREDDDDRREEDDRQEHRIRDHLVRRLAVETLAARLVGVSQGIRGQRKKRKRE